MPLKVWIGVIGSTLGAFMAMLNIQIANARESSSPGRLDVILIGHEPQSHGGLDMARALHEIAPRQPLLLATASSIDGNFDAFAEAGILRRAAPAPRQPRTRRGPGPAYTRVGRVTAVTRLPIAEILM